MSANLSMLAATARQAIQQPYNRNQDSNALRNLRAAFNQPVAELLQFGSTLDPDSQLAIGTQAKVGTIATVIKSLEMKGYLNSRLASLDRVNAQSASSVQNILRANPTHPGTSSLVVLEAQREALVQQEMQVLENAGQSLLSSDDMHSMEMNGPFSHTVNNQTNQLEQQISAVKNRMLQVTRAIVPTSQIVAGQPIVNGGISLLTGLSDIAAINDTNLMLKFIQPARKSLANTLSAVATMVQSVPANSPQAMLWRQRGSAIVTLDNAIALNQQRATQKNAFYTQLARQNQAADTYIDNNSFNPNLTQFTAIDSQRRAAGTSLAQLNDVYGALDTLRVNLIPNAPEAIQIGQRMNAIEQIMQPLNANYELTLQKLSTF